jgi:hypothetical protein
VTGCGVDAPVTLWTCSGAGQQLQVQGGQVVFAAQAGHAHAHPPPLELEPASAGAVMRMHEPEGHGVVKQAIPSSIQEHASAVSLVHDAASVWVVQGSTGGVLQSQGGHSAPAGQAGQTHTGGAVVEPPEPPAPVAEPLFADPAVAVLVGTVVVIVVTAPQAQAQVGHGPSAGHCGQLQVHVLAPAPPQPPPLPPVAFVPVLAPAPVLPPAPGLPPEPELPPAPEPQSHLQGGQVWPGKQAGQEQLHTPPPLDSAVSAAGAGGGQSQVTVGQDPLVGQATG